MRSITVKPVAGRVYEKATAETPSRTESRYYRYSYGENDSLQIGTSRTSEGTNTYIYGAHNLGAWLTFDQAALNVLEPYAAQTGTAVVTMTLSDVANLRLKCGVMSTAMPDSAESGYNALKSLGTSNVIEIGSQTITLTLSSSDFAKMKQYGIGIFPVTEATPVAQNNSHWEHIIPNRQTAVCSLSNLASPGIVLPINPTDHGYVVAGEDTTITYRYSQESGANMAYLGARYTNLGTGETVQLVRKSSVSIADGGTGTITIPANTLAEGKYRFDFSGMPTAATSYYSDSSDVWMTGSSAEFNVKLNPSTSAISCDGKPVPTISWTSTGQAAYQVRFGDYDSGARSGNQTSFTVPRIFADGSYPAQVRTATNAGEWSGWTDVEYVAITNSAPSGTVTAAAEKFGENVRINWTSTVSSPTNYAVFRDGALIGVTTGTEFVDRFANAGSYVVYAVKNGYYRASGAVSFRAALRYDVISADGGLTYTRLKFTPDLKSQPESHQTEVSFAWFAGRRKPIAMTANQKTRVKQFSYIYHKRADAEFLIDLEGQEILLKNTRGAVIYGILSGLTISDERCPAVSFSVQEIEREDEIVEYHV